MSPFSFTSFAMLRSPPSVPKSRGAPCAGQIVACASGSGVYEKPTTSPLVFTRNALLLVPPAAEPPKSRTASLRVDQSAACGVNSTPDMCDQPAMSPALLIPWANASTPPSVLSCRGAPPAGQRTPRRPLKVVVYPTTSPGSLILVGTPELPSLKRGSSRGGPPPAQIM